MKKRNTLLIIAASVAGFCVICAFVSILYSRTPQGIAGATGSVQTKTAQPTNTPRNTARPANTKAPTSIPKPTSTQAPTNTPRATSTPTPAPQPIILSGSGDSVVDVGKWVGPAYVHIVGPSVQDNFVVQSYDSNGEQIDLLVNAIGAYDGYQIIDVSDEQTARFQVETSGGWTIEVYPFTRSYVPVLDLPGKFEGSGDAVFVLGNGNPDLANISTGSEKDNFFLYSYGQDSGIDLLVNEISPYSGTIIIPADALIIAVHAGTTWSIEFTAK